MLDSPAAQGMIDRINRWVCKHSADPILPNLTKTAMERESVRDIMDHFPSIRDEILAALPYAQPIQGDMFFGPDITDDGKWDRIYIKWYAPPSKRAREIFPVTTQIIERHKDVHLAMISILRPGAKIKAHRGPWCGSFRVHVGVSTPKKSLRCQIVVANQVYFWRDGEVFAFDDTYWHSVHNDTDEARVILFLDVERKMEGWWRQSIVRFLNKTVARLTTRD